MNLDNISILVEWLDDGVTELYNIADYKITPRELRIEVSGERRTHVIYLDEIEKVLIIKGDSKFVFSIERG